MQKEKQQSVADARLFLLWLWLVMLLPATNPLRANITDAAQNTAFQSGETTQYDLYYNWKFVWVKAGSATMSVTTTTYNGQPAYRTRILTRGSSQADKFWVLRDTLTSVMTYDLLPLSYTKTDMEGTKYRVRHVWFNYQPDGKTQIRQQYINPYGKIRWKQEESVHTVFDMASILMRARSLDATKMQPGHKIQFLMSDGDGVSQQTLIYRGKKNIRMKDNNATYRCLRVSFVEYANGKEKEVGTFFVTDDDNHLPVACYLYLNIGSARIYMTGYKNLKNPMKARVK